MEGTRIVLIRHGESTAQAEQVVGGHAGCRGLSDKGRAQAEALRDRLARTGELRSPPVLYASLMPRAVETAAIIAPAMGLDPGQIVQECDFCEAHPGESDGMTWQEVAERFPSPSVWDPDRSRDPGGESWREMAARVARGLDGVIARHPGETIVIACHGGVIVHSMLRWLGLGLAGFDERAWINPRNTSITEWRHAENPWQKGTLPLELVRYNDHAHLQLI